MDRIYEPRFHVGRTYASVCAHASLHVSMFYGQQTCLPHFPGSRGKGFKPEDWFLSINNLAVFNETFVYGRCCEEDSGNYRVQKAQSWPLENLQPRVEGELHIDSYDKKAPEGRCYGTGLNTGLWGCCCCSVAELCLTLSDPMDCSMPGFPVLHYLPEFAQVHIHWVGDAIPSYATLFSFCVNYTAVTINEKTKYKRSLPPLREAVWWVRQHRFESWICYQLCDAG